MALKANDVIATLNDSVTLNMFFFVGPIYVSAIGYRLVRDSIYGGGIEVLEGASGQNWHSTTVQPTYSRRRMARPRPTWTNARFCSTNARMR